MLNVRNARPFSRHMSKSLLTFDLSNPSMCTKLVQLAVTVNDCCCQFEIFPDEFSRGMTTLFMTVSWKSPVYQLKYTWKSMLSSNKTRMIHLLKMRSFDWLLKIPRKFEYFQGKVLISLALEKVEFLQQPYSFKDKWRDSKEGKRDYWTVNILAIAMKANNSKKLKILSELTK